MSPLLQTGHGALSTTYCSPASPVRFILRGPYLDDGFVAVEESEGSSETLKVALTSFTNGMLDSVGDLQRVFVFPEPQDEPPTFS